MSTNTNITLAYRPQEFMDLGVTIAQWAANEKIYASFPHIVENGGRWYYFFSFGHCPSQSGQPALVAWDDLNGVYLYWDGEDPAYNWEISILENAEVLGGIKFADLAALTTYIATGELPK